MAHVFVPKKAKCADELSNSEYGDEGGQSDDSEVLEYEADVPEIKYKIIKLKLTDHVPAVPIDKIKMLKFDCKKTKTNPTHLIDMLAKKQLAMMFCTNQQQHLIGSQKE